MNYQEFFKGKKVTQLGLGLLGRGLNDAIFMLENGVADLIVTDKKSAEELAPSVKILREAKLPANVNLTLRLGEHRLEDFENRDFILKGAGVPLDSPFIAHARENGIPIEMDASLFCKLLPEGVITIGVTGTRGKSTVSHLITHILSHFLEQGFPLDKKAKRKVFLGGNIRDMATLPLLKEVKSGDYVVLELDSWQLQGFGESGISPHVAVFTNLMPDHLNYYQNNIELYLDDKANIYKYQTNDDYLIVGDDVVSKVVSGRWKVVSKMRIAKKEIIPKDWKIKIPGEHNLANIACAVEACRAFGINEEDIKKGVESFSGVEGRLQFVKEIGGVKIYNDNNSTTPEATIVALEALSTKLQAPNYKQISNFKPEISNKNIVLICGGADKGLELDELVEKINQTCKTVILLPGSGSDKLETRNQKLETVIKAQNLNEAVKTALSHCAPHDHFLFSPAFASFGLFKNEYERNDEFMKIVNKL